MAKLNSRNETAASRTFDICNYIFLALYGLTTLLPFLYILASSFATEAEIIERPFFIIPRTPSLHAYRVIFTTDSMWNAAKNSVFITVVGTVLAMTITLMTAYALTKPIIGRKPLIGLFIFSMFFSGGMIPTYIVVSGIGLLDSLWAVILPGAMSVYNMVIVRNFFLNLPAGLMESAEIDGAGHMRVLAQIVLPLSMPVIATFSLFYAVGFWNQYFNALLYINKQSMWPLQVLLRAVVMQSQLNSFDTASLEYVGRLPENSIKMAVIMVATLPIMLLYPFLQKYFTKGVMIGAIKG